MRITIDRGRQTRPGSVLLAVLIVLPLLFLAAYQFGELMFQEYSAASSALKSAQAKALAMSGINMCAVYLSSPTGLSGNLNNNPYSNTSSFQNVAVTDNSGNVIGHFSIVAAYDINDSNFSQNSSSSFRYGVIDESGKINLNSLYKLDPTGNILTKVLQNLSPDGTASGGANTGLITSQFTDSLLDWFDPDENARPNGAESQYYNTLNPPYNSKNYFLDSVDELLLIQGMTPQILYGSDWNRNGMQDPGEDTGGGWNPGLAPYLTVYSRELNTDPNNNPRTNVNGTISSTYLTNLQSALNNDLANFIVLYRTSGGDSNSAAAPKEVQSDFSGNVSSYVQTLVSSNTPPTGAAIPSLFNLINKTLYFSVTTTTRNGGRTTITRKIFTVPSPLSNTSQMSTLLPTLLNEMSTSSAKEFPGKINILTAPESVLNAFVGVLGGLTTTDVQNIISSRPDVTQGLPTDAQYQSLAWLVITANLSPTKVAALDSYFSSRTSVYRIQAIGYFDNGGPTARIEAVVDATNGNPRIVMWRDLSELGKGYNVNSTEK